MMVTNCTKLVELGTLKEEDNYDALRTEAFKGLRNFEQQLDRVDSDIQRYPFNSIFLFSSLFSLNNSVN